MHRHLLTAILVHGPRRLLGNLGGDPRWMEAGSGLTAMLWSVLVYLGPGDLADRPGYQPLARFAPDAVWVVLTAVAGVLQFAAARRNQLEARLVLAVVVGMLFMLLGDGLRLGAPWSPTLGLYLGVIAQNVAAMVLLVSLMQGRR